MTDRVMAQRHRLNENSTLDEHTRRRASLTLAEHATDSAELATWLEHAGAAAVRTGAAVREEVEGEAMSVVDWLTARLHCLLRGHDMVQCGRLEQCRRCGACWWDLEVER